MNSSRYQELLGRLLEDDLSASEAEELAAGLEASHELRQDLRRHLALWEIWSQHQAPERSPEAFINAWKTRFRAENEDPDAFPTAVRTRFEARQPRQSARERLVRFLWTGIRRPASLAWTAPAFLLVFAAVLWFAVPWTAHAVITLRGEAVCTACVLHESDEHAPAIRVITGNATNIYYLDRRPELTALQDYFCSGPNVAIAEGSKRTEKSKLLFQATTVTIPAANQPHETPSPTNSVRKIFPI